MIQIQVNSQWTQNICITFIQRQTNVFDVGPTLYKCYTNVLCLLGYGTYPGHPWHRSSYDTYPGHIWHRSSYGTYPGQLWYRSRVIMIQIQGTYDIDPCQLWYIMSIMVHIQGSYDIDSVMIQIQGSYDIDPSSVRRSVLCINRGFLELWWKCLLLYSTQAWRLDDDGPGCRARGQARLTRSMWERRPGTYDREQAYAATDTITKIIILKIKLIIYIYISGSIVVFTVSIIILTHYHSKHEILAKVGLTLAQHLRRWPSVKTALAECLLMPGIYQRYSPLRSGMLTSDVGEIKSKNHPPAHNVVATLNQRQWRWFNVEAASCAQWVHF